MFIPWEGVFIPWEDMFIPPVAAIHAPGWGIGLPFVAAM
jgi:hypothetical protein